MASIKLIKIRTGVVKRITKEVCYYEREVIREKQRLEKFVSDGKDEYELKHQEEVIRESARMVPHCLNELREAYNNLKTALEFNTDLSDTEEYQLSKIVLAEAEVILQLPAMFTLIAKLVLTAYDSLAGHRVKEKESSQSLPVKQRSFRGKVTALNKIEDYGIIDREVYFSFDVVYAQKELCIGDLVLVNVSREEPFHAWTATHVELVLSHSKIIAKKSAPRAVPNKKMLEVETNSVFPVLSQSSFPKGPARMVRESEERKERTETVDQTVSECNEEFGKLKDGLLFDVESGEIDFVPITGDVLSVTISYSEKGKVVTSWKPKEVKCVEGDITACENDCGIIDDNVVYFPRSCRKRVHLFVGQKVSAMVVSSEQGLFKWRAYSLCSSDKEESDTDMRKAYVSHKEGIDITEPLNFGNISLGKENDLVVNIENNTGDNLLLLNCNFQNRKGVFFLGKPIPSQSIPENTSLEIAIHCKTEAIGQHDDFLLFEFPDFIIKRLVTVTVVDPMQHILKPVAPFSRVNKRQSTLDCESLVIIPGKKPFKPIQRFSNKLPPCPIPRNLMKAVESRKDLSLIVPHLYRNLTMKNYVTIFSTLLHLEEIAVRIDMRKFDISEGLLRRKGEFLSLAVEGLAEGRPSLIVGDKAILVPPHQKSSFAFEGYIHEVLLNEVLLKFNDSFHNSYGGESFDVRFELSRTNFRRLHQCVQHAAENHEYAIFPTRAGLRNPLIDLGLFNNKFHDNGKVSNPDDAGIEWKNPKLNWKQKEAVLRILESRCRPLPYIIFGPPGTGKTITLVEAVLQVYQNIPSSKIIICTPSNSAADLVALRIIETNLIGVGEMVRLNSYQRNVDCIPEFLQPYCQNKDVLDHVDHFRIIISTCSTAGTLYNIGLCHDFFTHVFIDEAGQLMEPESDIALGFIDSVTEGQVVMAGDPQQLGPVLRSSHAISNGLQVSYLERIMHTPLYDRNETKFKQYGGYNPLLVTMLEESYRSHPDILKFPSDMFYFSQIICRFPSDLDCKLSEWECLPHRGFPVIFHGVKGEEFREQNSPSWFNPAEVVQVTKYLQKLYDFGLTPDDVGIIAPYKKQVEKIRMMMSALDLKSCKLGSVEEFQGQERRAIVISTVRSSDRYVNSDILFNLGFMSNPKRLNVAITRSRELLIVVGNPYVLSKDLSWHSFVRYCVVNGCYTGCELPLSFSQNKGS